MLTRIRGRVVCLHKIQANSHNFMAQEVEGVRILMMIRRIQLFNFLHLIANLFSSIVFVLYAVELIANAFVKSFLMFLLSIFGNVNDYAGESIW